MRKLLFVIPLLLSAPSFPLAQSQHKEPSTAEQVALQKQYLNAELRALNAETAKLTGPLARAAAKAEIADAAWSLDRNWSSELLREAYELTFPPAEEREKLRGHPVGADPSEPSKTDMVRGGIRNRVLRIAGRDKALAAQLAQLGAQHLGNLEEVQRYSMLGVRAIEAGDAEAAGDYFLQAIEADPTQVAIGMSLFEVAARDRDLADKLLVQYIERLRATPLTRNAARRTYVALRRAVFPDVNLDPQRRLIAPAGRAVVRAYVSYVLESMARTERSEPGSAKSLRGFLLSVWLPLNQYAAELSAAFMELESASRGPGESGQLPSQSAEEMGRSAYEERLKTALDSRLPEDLIEAFNYALGLEDFAKARELHRRLPEGAEKERLGEELNVRESLRLASRGESAESERLARLLSQPASVLRVYPTLINKCIAGNDNSCAANLVHQAVKQLKAAEGNPSLSFVLSRLSAAAALADITLALDVLDQAVSAANSSNHDTDDGGTDLYLDAFALLATKGEARVRQSAETLKDRFRRISALAVVYRWKAQQMAQEKKSPSGI